MKPSTVAELMGFAVISYAAWLLAPIAGLFTAGGLLVLTGYALEDVAALLILHRITAPLARKRAAWAQRRAVRRAKPKAV